jgi:hypothetical protein
MQVSTEPQLSAGQQYLLVQYRPGQPSAGVTSERACPVLVTGCIRSSGAPIWALCTAYQTCSRCAPVTSFVCRVLAWLRKLCVQHNRLAAGAVLRLALSAAKPGSSVYSIPDLRQVRSCHTLHTIHVHHVYNHARLLSRPAHQPCKWCAAGSTVTSCSTGMTRQLAG